MIRTLSSSTGEIPGHAFNLGVESEVREGAVGSGTDEGRIDKQKRREREREKTWKSGDKT